MLVFLLPVFGLAQIPKGHFLDSDGEIKPFEQESEGIYHYAILSELPFKNNCPKKQSEKKRIICAEDSLSELLQKQLTLETDYKGRVYIYLTVNKNAEIENVDVTSYPNSNEINEAVNTATKNLSVKPAIYNDQIVKARLWTFLALD
jgi:hypothetical protein|tara:strand:+ start:411 stop:851 length:441 start_codon:yes stop_codon:yes gene_type:complete